MTKSRELIFGDFHFHTRYSDNEDEATLEQMVEEGHSRELWVMAAADHHHNMSADDWTSLVADAAHLANRNQDRHVYEGCEISFRRGHFVAVQPDAYPGSVSEGFRILYYENSAVNLIAHPVRFMDRWRDVFYPGVHGIEVINGEVLQFFRRRKIPLRTLNSNPMLALYKRYLGAGLPVAAIGASDAHAISSVGSGVTGMWLYDEQDTPLSAVRQRRCYAATDTGVFMQWDMTDQVLRWKTAIDGEAPGRVSIYRGRKRLATISASGSMRLGKSGCYWIAAGSRERMGISSPVVIPECRIKPLRGKELVRVLEDTAYIDRQANQSLVPEWHDRATVVWTTVIAARPRFYDSTGKRVHLWSLPLPQRRALIRKRGHLDDHRGIALWLSRNEILEYSFCDLTWSARGSVLRVRATALPAIQTDRRSWESKYAATWTDMRKAASASDEFRLKVRKARRRLVRLPAGTGCLVLRDGQLTSSLGTVEVVPPRQFRKRLHGRVGPFLATIQRFT